MKKIKILVCCHKICPIPKDEIFLPIQVGCEKSKIKLGIQCDNELNGNTCDNISNLNGIYCEMTAMYWAWKNIKNKYSDIEYIGLCHYRRFFYIKNNIIRDWLKVNYCKIKEILKIIFAKKLSISLCNLEYKTNSVNSVKLEKSNKKLCKIIEKYDIITTKPSISTNTNIYSFFSVIGREYINCLTKIIDEYYFDYSETYYKTILGNTLHTANMLILKMDLFNDYCEFIFGVLEKHREMMVKDGIVFSPEKEKIYSRISGYLSEILTSVYIEEKRKKNKIKEISKIFIE